MLTLGPVMAGENQGLGLLANPRQEPFDRATLKPAISAIAAGRLRRSLRIGAPIAQRHCRGIGFLGCHNQWRSNAAGAVLGSYPFIAWVNRNLRRADALRNCRGIGLLPTVSSEQQCHKSVWRRKLSCWS